MDIVRETERKIHGSNFQFVFGDLSMNIAWGTFLGQDKREQINTVFYKKKRERSSIFLCFWREIALMSLLFPSRFNTKPISSCRLNPSVLTGTGKDKLKKRPWDWKE